MRAWLTIAAAALQILALAYIGAEREYVVRTGKTVYLRTAPVDPRDLFRGDFVSLNYDVSAIPRRLLQGGLSDNRNKTPGKKGDRVYVVLNVDENNLADILYATDKKPENGLFIRGRLDNGFGGSIRVRYGIEAYFVEQGRGREIEKARSRENIQIPLEMEIALGCNGVAVLKDHRWSPLGIGIELERGEGRVARGVKLRLLNASDKPLAIVDLPGNRSFSLEPDLSRWWSANDWRWVNDGVTREPVGNNDVHVLKPGEIYEFRISFNDPAWFVAGKDQPPRPLTDVEVERGLQFRLVYRLPSKKECAHLDKADLIWHGYMPSRAFSGRGWID